ncbi:MAG: hypothetical protein KatS3mg111_1121 [Pirellulaceae bacterium]|nr:MAG: hypothetical protein KatS3mg111_1121 [Pirellulaceae bacterium]
MRTGQGQPGRGLLTRKAWDWSIDASLLIRETLHHSDNAVPPGMTLECTPCRWSTDPSRFHFFVSHASGVCIL